MVYRLTMKALGRLDAVRHGWADPDPSIGRLTLMQLSRIPSARAAVFCYATIASHAAPHVYPTAGAFLRKERDATVEGVMRSMRCDMGGGLPVTGWYELVRELGVQHVRGRL